MVDPEPITPEELEALEARYYSYDDPAIWPDAEEGAYIFRLLREVRRLQGLVQEYPE